MATVVVLPVSAAGNGRKGATATMASVNIRLTVDLCATHAVSNSFLQSTPLEDSFRFSYMRRGKAAVAVKEGEPQGAPEPNVVHPYENSIKVIGSVQNGRRVLECL